MAAPTRAISEGRVRKNMNKKDAEKVIEDLKDKPFICGESTIETDSGYVISLKTDQHIKTNADLIRSMTDEELAVTIMCPNETGMANIECNNSDGCNCRKCCLKWLQSEVEE